MKTILNRSLLLVLVLLLCAGLAASATDLTVFVNSDTHFTSRNVPTNDKVCIQAMNGLPSTAYPSAIGGYIAVAAADITCGDLCDGGLNTRDTGTGRTYESQWTGYDYCFSRYGVIGNTIRLKYPNYAVAGNHDIYRTFGNASLGGQSWYAVNKLKARYALPYDFSSGNVYYSVDMDGVHFASIGVWPDVGVTAWLTADLDQLPAGTPVVLFCHYDVATWGSANLQRLSDAISGHRIIAILHGHTHSARHYVWNAIDVYDAGSSGYNRDLAVMHITDTRFTYAHYQAKANSRGNWFGGTWKFTHVKTL